MADKQKYKNKTTRSFFEKNRMRGAEGKSGDFHNYPIEDAANKETESIVHSTRINIVGNLQEAAQQQEDGFVVIPGLAKQSQSEEEKRLITQQSYSDITDWVDSFKSRGDEYENAFVEQFVSEAKEDRVFGLLVYFVLETGKELSEIPKDYTPNPVNIQKNLEPSSFFNIFRSHSKGFKRFDFRKLSEATRKVKSSKEYEESSSVVESIMGGIEASATLGSSVISTAQLFSSNMSATALKQILASSTSFTAITAVLSFLGGAMSAMSFADAVASVDSVTKTDTLLAGMQAVGGLSSAAGDTTTVVGSVTTISQTAQVAAGALSIAAGGLTTLVGAIGMGEAITTKFKAKKAEGIFEQLKEKRRRALGIGSTRENTDGYEGDVESGDQSEARLLDEKYQKGILALQSRISNRDLMDSGTGVLTGGMCTAAGALALTGVGAPIALVLAAAGGITMLTGKVISSIIKKKDYNPVIDWFLNCEGIYKQNRNHEEYRGREKSSVIEKIRREEMAKLGFCSRSEMLAYINTVYAKHIYSKLFDESISEEEREGYTELVRSIGLKVKYKNRDIPPGQKKERNFFQRIKDKAQGDIWENMPTQEMIFQKLMK